MASTRKPVGINFDKMLLSLKDDIHGMVEDYEETNLPISDDSERLRTFCERLEFLLKFGLKERSLVLGGRKDLWPYLCRCLEGRRNIQEGIALVKANKELKTNTGRHRYFLRYCLLQRCLADVLQQCIADGVTTLQFYDAGSLLLRPHFANDLVTCLYALSDLTFDLASSGGHHDLDVCWPAYARVGGASPWSRPPSRTWSMSSLCSSSSMAGSLAPVGDVTSPDSSVTSPSSPVKSPDSSVTSPSSPVTSSLSFANDDVAVSGVGAGKGDIVTLLREKLALMESDNLYLRQRLLEAESPLRRREGDGRGEREDEPIKEGGEREEERGKEREEKREKEREEERKEKREKEREEERERGCQQCKILLSEREMLADQVAQLETQLEKLARDGRGKSEGREEEKKEEEEKEGEKREEQKERREGREEEKKEEEEKEGEKREEWKERREGREEEKKKKEENEGEKREERKERREGREEEKKKKEEKEGEKREERKERREGREEEKKEEEKEGEKRGESKKGKEEVKEEKENENQEEEKEKKWTQVTRAEEREVTRAEEGKQKQANLGSSDSSDSGHSLELKIVEAEGRLKKNEALLTRREMEHSTLREEFESLREKYEERERALRIAEERVGQLENSEKTSQNKLHLATELADRLKNAHEELNAEHSRLKNEVMSIEEEMKELRRELERNKAEREEEQEAMRQKANALEEAASRISSLEDDRRKLEEELEMKKKEDEERREREEREERERERREEEERERGRMEEEARRQKADALEEAASRISSLEDERRRLEEELEAKKKEDEERREREERERERREEEERERGRMEGEERKRKERTENEKADLLEENGSLRERIIQLLREKDSLWHSNQRLEEVATWQRRTSMAGGAGGRGRKAEWQRDATASECATCGAAFTLIRRRHHCRHCGRIFCSGCVDNWILTEAESRRVRVCDECFSVQAELASIVDSLPSQWTSRTEGEADDTDKNKTKNKDEEEGEGEEGRGGGGGGGERREGERGERRGGGEEEESDEDFAFISEEEVQSSRRLGSSPGSSGSSDSDSPQYGSEPICTSSALLSAEGLRERPLADSEVWVKAGHRYLIPVKLPSGVILRWCFTSEPKNVSFAVLHQPEEREERESAQEDGGSSLETFPSSSTTPPFPTAAATSSSTLSPPRVLIPTTRVASAQGSAIKGRLSAKQPGIYTFLFDNSFARYTAKKVMFSLAIEAKEEAEGNEEEILDE